MELKRDIIDAAVSFLTLLGCCDDDDFVEYVVGAIYNNDVKSLYDLEDSFGE